jgi:large subunit ribosomal protein L16
MRNFNLIKKNQKRLIKVQSTEKNRIFKSKKNRYILKSLTFSLLKDFQLKAAIRIMKQLLKKSGKLIIHVHPLIGITKKPLEVRMGKGKGSKIAYYSYPIRPGKILFEIESSNINLIYEVFKIALSKLSLKGKIFIV